LFGDEATERETAKLAAQWHEIHTFKSEVAPMFLSRNVRNHQPAKKEGGFEPLFAGSNPLSGGGIFGGM
jgi:hypothetical protein